jgi:hypothetical protein
MLQSKAGYIDARPHIRPLDEVLLQCTAGPYIWVRSGHHQSSSQCPLSSQERTSRTWLDMSAKCQKRTYAPQQNNLYSRCGTLWAGRHQQRAAIALT